MLHRSYFDIFSSKFSR